MSGTGQTSRVPVGAARPGGRAARVRRDVLGATNDLLRDGGYEAVSVDEVARSAGVHKTTVYRRWPTVPELVADAVGLDADERVPIPDTGSLRGDLVALASAIADQIASSEGRALARSLVAASLGGESVADVLHAVMRRRIDDAEVIVHRAADRGEVASQVDARAVVEAVAGAIWFRVLLTDEPVDARVVDAIVSAADPGS